MENKENKTIILHLEAWEQMMSLPAKEQKAMKSFFKKFLTDPSSKGIHWHPVTGAKEKNVFAVDIGIHYRGIIFKEDSEEGSTYTLAWVDHHDEAYKWAENKRLDVNSKVKGIELYTDMGTDLFEDNTHQASLFDAYKDDDLLGIGVPKDLLNYVRSIATKEDFQTAKDNIPKYPYENLSMLVERTASIDELLTLVQEQRPEDAGDRLSDVLNSPATQESFMVIEGEEDLQKIMDGTLEEWRVFLHPTQRMAAAKDYYGPALVLGGAGTGKTVVAMHRAKCLASKCESGKKVLVTTFTTNLADDIAENLRGLCTPKEMKKIEVINLDKWVSEFLKEKTSLGNITYANNNDDNDQITYCWETAIELAENGLPYEPSFYREEWEQVVTNQEEITCEQYVNADRDSQRIALSHEDREKIWNVFENYMEQMESFNSIDAQMAMHECTKILKEDTPSEYAHIIVDEGQDFSDNAYRLIRALAGDQHQNDIFIVGDSHQRIYENFPTLSKCGINIEDRVNYLLINYRTTDEIQKEAFSLLDGIKFDDLNGGTDPVDTCISLTYGEKPIKKNFKTADKEMDFLIKKLTSLQKQGINPSDICIAARTNSLVKTYRDALKKAGIRSYEIKTEKIDDRGIEGIRIATMHRLKGLEFQYVFIVRVNDGIIPLKSAKTDSVSKEQALDSEKSLLYVAMTRAQRGVYLTSYGNPSEFLK